MYLFLLVSHIAVGIVTGVAAAYAGVALVQKREHAYRGSALVLGGLATYEILSGVALAVVSYTISVPSLCENIALYLAAVFIVETLLFVAMKKRSMSFPFAQTLSPVMGSLAVFLAAIALGV